VQHKEYTADVYLAINLRRCALNWLFTTDRPIYVQIVELIQRMILSGFYPMGSSIPSVRVLALEAGVNPNTMQKALAELENMGLLHTMRSSGRVVTTDQWLIMQLRDGIVNNYVENYFSGMLSLGFDRNAAIEQFWTKANGDAVFDSDLDATTETDFADSDRTEEPTEV